MLRQMRRVHYLDISAIDRLLHSDQNSFVSVEFRAENKSAEAQRRTHTHCIDTRCLSEPGRRAWQLENVISQSVTHSRSAKFSERFFLFQPSTTCFATPPAIYTAAQRVHPQTQCVSSVARRIHNTHSILPLPYIGRADQHDGGRLQLYHRDVPQLLLHLHQLFLRFDGVVVWDRGVVISCFGLLWCGVSHTRGGGRREKMKRRRQEKTRERESSKGESGREKKRKSRMKKNIKKRQKRQGDREEREGRRGRKGEGER
jgi:hypothetical protein